MENWQKMSQDESRRITEAVNPSIEPVPFEAEQTMVRVQPLSFYIDYKLYELTDFSAVPAAKKYALYAPGKTPYVLSWTNQAIYDANAVAPVQLNAQTVADYVRFFFHYVRGRHGRFLVVETVDDIKWQNDPPPQGRKAMAEILSPVTLTGQDADGGYDLTAFMVFKDALFKTSINVTHDGTVSLSNEELKVEGLPVLADTLVA